MVEVIDALHVQQHKRAAVAERNDGDIDAEGDRGAAVAGDKYGETRGIDAGGEKTA